VGKNALITTKLIRISITFVKSQTFTKVNTRKISAKFKNEKKRFLNLFKLLEEEEEKIYIK
jgi:hypothetical protein